MSHLETAARIVFAVAAMVGTVVGVFLIVGPRNGK